MATLSTTTIDDTLTVDGNLRAKSKAIVSGNLEVSGTSTLNKNVAIKEKGRLCISGDTDITQNNDKAIAVYSTNSTEYGTEPIFSVGNATGVTNIAGKLTCAGPMQVDGNFYAKGDVEDSTFTVNTPATFNKTLTAQDVLNIKGTKAPDNRPTVKFFFGNSSTATSFIEDFEGTDLDISAKRVNLGRTTVGSSSTDPSYGWIVIDSVSGNVYPYTSQNYSLGSPKNLWYAVHTANGVTQSSLAEMKENIVPFTSALEEIDKTDIFNYNLKGNSELHTGFVIGEGYKLSKLLLDANEKGINLYKAIGVSFGGVKELYQIVKDQQKEINNLKEEISLLKDKIG